MKKEKKEIADYFILCRVCRHREKAKIMKCFGGYKLDVVCACKRKWQVFLEGSLEQKGTVVLVDRSVQYGD